jgi:hypothetical protein
MVRKLAGIGQRRCSSFPFLNPFSQLRSNLGRNVGSLLATAGLFVVVCTLGNGTAMAQAVYGSIAGTVFDGSGAPIPNASDQRGKEYHDLGYHQ